MKCRKDKDSMGYIDIKKNKYWGPQTQRSIENFNIGSEKMPQELINALALIKKCAALANKKLDILEARIADAIVTAADQIPDLPQHFPLSVWQTGSGTQTNMNMNEVLANLANETLGSSVGLYAPVHPNDHVNRGQSSNDTFPSAMNISITLALHNKLLPSLNNMYEALEQKIADWSNIIKVGRTHLQDATPITLGQEFSGYASQIMLNIQKLKEHISSQGDIVFLAQGGTAVGTGLNCHEEFTRIFIENLREFTNFNFQEAKNKFRAIATHDDLVSLSGSLNTLAVSLMKIANDIRLLGSGPRCGIGELTLPTNELGSSIMPGKVNPTQCEALTMVCAQVMGNNFAVSIGGAGGQLELNAYKPLILYNILQSINLLTDSVSSFTEKCLKGIQPNEHKISQNLNDSLMLVTALNPYIGYDRATKIAKNAHEKGISLKESAVSLGILTEKEFDTYVNANNMV
jgi:fumarate hydratase class II